MVLMDPNLPTMTGVEATRRITAQADPPAVLVVTMVDDDDTVVAAVRTVADGGAVFGAGVAAQVLTLTSTTTQPAGSDPAALTDREREVLALIADGASNAQIARALGLSLKTVRDYVCWVLDKLSGRQPHPGGAAGPAMPETPLNRGLPAAVPERAGRALASVSAPGQDG
jgi:DNA-binding NarL/FixJ family response regulator